MKIDQWTKFLMTVAGDASAEAIIRGGDTGEIIGLAKRDSNSRRWISRTSAVAMCPEVSPTRLLRRLPVRCW
jgi:hypothetical protein